MCLEYAQPSNIIPKRLGIESVIASSTRGTRFQIYFRKVVEQTALTLSIPLVIVL